MKAAEASCSVVIRCYNEEKHIGRLLSGIMQQTIKDAEIIVVDSGSTDATVAVASRFPVKILSIRPEEFSFGRSLNIGCDAAKADLVVIASAHVYPVYKDWLERLIAAFASPQVALVYGKQRGNESSKFSEHEIFAKWFPKESNPQQDHPFCNNANAAIRRSLWERLPYDETLTGLEDLDWAKRAMQLGHKISYIADAEIVHVHDETSTSVYNRYRREAIALKHVFPHERFNLWNFVRLFAANSTTDCYHAWQDGILSRNWANIFSFRFMQFWGTYRGFSQSGPIGTRLRQRFYYPAGRTRAHPEPSREPERRVQYVDVKGD